MLITLLACAASPTDPTTTASAPGSEVWPEVAALVESRCSACHQPGGAGMDFTVPEVVQAMAPAMASAVLERRMPPWAAWDTPDCSTSRPWTDDRRPSPEEVELLVAWADAGAPLPADAAPVRAGAPVGLVDGYREAVPAGSYASQGGQDEFWCFVADPGLTEDLWIEALEVVPENDAIAHHALVYVDVSGTAETLADADGWFDCSAGLRVPDLRFMSTWVPGAGPTWAPPGTAMFLAEEARFVVQMHFHPSGAVGAEDRPAVRFQEAPSAPDFQLVNTLLGNAGSEAEGLLPGPGDRSAVEFRVPAQASGHTEEMVTVLDGAFPDLPVVSVGAHMHLVGTRMEVWIDRATPDTGEPASECIMGVDGYQYDWQQQYRYDVALEDMPMVSSGDTLRLKCTYDNTLDNPGLQRALDDAGLDEPVDVLLGEGTLDEMCVFMVGYAY